MFSPQSPTRTNIEEANRHLQMLHNRIAEMEQTIDSQADAILGLQSKEEEMAQITKFKETENAELKRRLEISERQVSELMQQNEQKDMVIRNLKGKCKHIAEILSYQQMLQNLVTSMAKVNLDKSDSSMKSHRRVTKMEINGAGEKLPTDSDKQSTNLPSSKSHKFLQRTLNHRLRNLSVSEDEYDADEDDDKRKVMRKMKRDKELYL